MTFNVGDEITFDGSMDKTKEVEYSGLKTEKEKKIPFFGETHILRTMILQPHSHLRVTEIYGKYYICEKIWESGDEEIPVLGRGVLVDFNEAIPYDKTYDGTVINKRKR